MGERFRLVGVSVHDGNAELRLACSQEDAYRWSFKGERAVLVSDDPSGTFMSQQAIDSGCEQVSIEARGDECLAVAKMIDMFCEGLGVGDDALARAARRLRTMVLTGKHHDHRQTGWVPTPYTKVGLSAAAEGARGRVYDEHSETLGNGGIRGCNPHDVPNRRCEAQAWEKLAGEILADARVLAAELDRTVRRG